MWLDSALPCTLFCQLQALLKSKIDYNDRKNAFDKANFAVRIAGIQMARGRFFYFEHSDGCVMSDCYRPRRFEDVQGCRKTVLRHMCAFNLTAWEGFWGGASSQAHSYSHRHAVLG